MNAKIGHVVTKNRPEWYKSYIRVREEDGVVLYRMVMHCQENNPVDYCSECGKRLCSRFANYCPNCGVKIAEGTIWQQ